jgi:hypothetical protein
VFEESEFEPSLEKIRERYRGHTIARQARVCTPPDWDGPGYSKFCLSYTAIVPGFGADSTVICGRGPTPEQSDQNGLTGAKLLIDFIYDNTVTHPLLQEALLQDFQEEKLQLLCTGDGCEALRIRVVQTWQHSPPRDLIVHVRNVQQEDVRFTIEWNGILGGGVTQTFTILGGQAQDFTAPNRLVGARITSASIIDTRP